MNIFNKIKFLILSLFLILLFSFLGLNISRIHNNINSVENDTFSSDISFCSFQEDESLPSYSITNSTLTQTTFEIEFTVNTGSLTTEQINSISAPTVYLGKEINDLSVLSNVHSDDTPYYNYTNNNENNTKGTISIQNLEHNEKYYYKLSSSYDKDNYFESEPVGFDTKDWDEPIEPSVTNLANQNLTQENNEWVYKYEILVSKASDVQYKTNIIKVSIGNNGNSDYYGSQNIDEEQWNDSGPYEITGSVSLEKIKFDASYQLYVTIDYVDEENNEYSVKSEADIETTDKYIDDEPTKNNVSVSNITQTTATIDYSFSTPEAAFGHSQSEIKEIKVFDEDDKDIDLSSTNSRDTLLIENLETGTTYSSYKLKVYYDIKVPNYEISDVGHIISENNVMEVPINEFTTLDGPVINSDLEFVDSSVWNKNIELKISLIDDESEFNPSDLSIKVQENGKERTFNESDLIINEISNEKNSYSITLSNIKLRSTYNDWQISITTPASYEEINLVNSSGIQLNEITTPKVNVWIISIGVIALVVLIIIIIVIIIIVKKVGGKTKAATSYFR